MRKYFLSHKNRFGGLEGEMYDDDEIELNSQGRSPNLTNNKLKQDGSLSGSNQG